MSAQRRATTRDGVEYEVRPITAADREALRDAFERLSEESRHRRFLASIKHLSERDLTQLTELDHTNREALIALTTDGELIGVARFVRVESPPASAEVAVTVADVWQARGVGTELLRGLAERARELGVERFVATCLANNGAMLDLFRELGTSVRERDAGEGVVEVDIELPTSG